MNFALVKYVLTGAIRDRLFISILGIMILGIFVSLFMSSSAIVEQDQFALVYLAGGLRILGLVGLILFVVFFVRRSFEARDVEYLLTRPVSRVFFIVSHGVAFSILSLAVSLVLCAGIGYFALKAGDGVGALYWCTGVVAEYLLLVNVALFFAMVLSSPVAAGLATFAFYVLARIMGQLLAIADIPVQGLPAFELFSNALKIVSMVIPRIDLMTQTSWLLYGVAGIKEYLFIWVQSILFLALIFTASVIDLVRRQF